MHARQRNGPGNGYRSNLLGMGSASRISPEGSMRGHRMYNNSEFRNFNRGGYGRGGIGGRGGYSKQFQPPVPPPRETDIFVEAGRLAAEYLVSRGVLPPNALSGKWQTDGLKNLTGDFQGFRSREVANAHIPVDGRGSAHSRVGNAAPDVDPGKRRYSEEYNSSGSRNFTRGSLRTGSSKNYVSEESSFKSHVLEVKREFGKSGSWAERSRASPGHRADFEASSGPEQDVAKDRNDGLQNPSPGEITQGANAAHIGSEMEKGDSLEDADGKASSLSDAVGEPAEESDDAKTMNADSEAVKEGKNGNDLDQNNDEDKEVKASNCDFSPMNEDSMNEDKKISEKELPEVDVSFENSTGNASSDQDHELKSFQADAINAVPVKKEQDVKFTGIQRQYLTSGSFPEGSVYKNQEPIDGKSEFGRSNSMFIDKVGKRVLDDDTDGREDFKKLREWVPVPPMSSQFNGSSHLSSSMENQSILQESRTSKGASEARSDDQSISLFPKGQANSCELMEEKQLFPGGSFKTCDLNFVDVNDNHDVKQVPVFPPVAEPGKEALPIDVDLSMSNNCNPPNRNGKQVVNNDDIEIIDLEDDSGQEDKTFSYSRRREDTLFSDLDGFHNTLHNANEIPDTQDGYGLMISELLGNHSPNSSSVASGLTSLHNHMGLPNEEVILGDDDSIYMSLEEIPISLLGPWEQPTQDYGKPF